MFGQKGLVAHKISRPGDHRWMKSEDDQVRIWTPTIRDLWVDLHGYGYRQPNLETNYSHLLNFEKCVPS